MVEASEQDRQGEREIHLLDLAAVFLRGWKTVVGITSVGVLAGVGVLWMQPREFTAQTVLIPSATAGSSAGGMLAMQVPGRLLDLMPGVNSNQRLIMAVLKSRSLGDAMLSQVAAGADSSEVRRAVMTAKVESRTEDGSIAIQISARKPNLASRIANEYPNLVNEIVARTSTETAQRKQALLETQLATVREQLVRSEGRLVDYQTQQDAPDPQAQAEQTFAAAAVLQQQINEQEVLVARLRRAATPDNPQLRAAEAQLSTRRAQLNRLTSGGGGRVFLPLSKSTELKATTARLMREYQKDEQVYNSLMAALAQVRIDANNTLPVVSVLDRGVEPAEPSRRHKGLILMAAALLGLLLGAAVVFIREQFRRARRSPAGEHFAAEWRQLRGRGAKPHHTGGNGRVAVGAPE